jgi:hypothetical protein
MCVDTHNAIETFIETFLRKKSLNENVVIN